MNRTWDDAGWQDLTGELNIWLEGGRRASFWWRDDDAGGSDPALGQLLSLAADLGLPLGLAVVPAWLTPVATGAIMATPTSVVVLQHGYAHTNHETQIQPGERKVRPSEYGTARLPQIASKEMTEGFSRLRGAFKGRFIPVFVPPWNRVAPTILAILPHLGYRGVSTFGPRPCAEPALRLLQVNCHADPILWREGKRFAGAGATLERLRAHLIARRSGQADPHEPTGILTHHRAMDPTCWNFLQKLFSSLRTQPAVSFPPLTSLFSAEGV
ncbi:MAG TPA: polysaccharide deacetylase family protein [Candidatus Methylomirabilis sp.]|nr:polysaccharide deacetylase family protein [Candidatus Methylomirabilis sp.]